MDGRKAGAQHEIRPGCKPKQSTVRNELSSLLLDRELADLAARRRLLAAKLFDTHQKDQIIRNNRNVSASGSAVRASHLRPILARKDYQKPLNQLQTENSTELLAWEQPILRDSPADATSRSYSPVPIDHQIPSQSHLNYHQQTVADREEDLRKRLHAIREMEIHKRMFPAVHETVNESLVPLDDCQNSKRSLDNLEKDLRRGLMSDREKELHEHLNLQHQEEALQQQINAIREKQRLLNCAADAAISQNRDDNRWDENSHDLWQRYPAKRIIQQKPEQTVELDQCYSYEDQVRIDNMLVVPSESHLEHRICYLKQEQELALTRQYSQAQQLSRPACCKDAQRLDFASEGIDRQRCMHRESERNTVSQDAYERLLRAQRLDQLEKQARASRTHSFQEDEEEAFRPRQTSRNPDIFGYEAEDAECSQEHQLGPLRASRSQDIRIGAQDVTQRRLFCDTNREGANYREHRSHYRMAPSILIATSNSKQHVPARKSTNAPLRIPLEDAEEHQNPYPDNARSSTSSRPSVRNAMEIEADMTSSSDDDEERQRARTSARQSVGMGDPRRKSSFSTQSDSDDKGNRRSTSKRLSDGQIKDKLLEEEPQSENLESVASAVNLEEDISEDDYDNDPENQKANIKSKTNLLHDDEDDINTDKPRRSSRDDELKEPRESNRVRNLSKKNELDEPSNKDKDSHPNQYKPGENSKSAPPLQFSGQASKVIEVPETEASPDPQEDNASPITVEEQPKEEPKRESEAAKRRSDQIPSKGRVSIPALNNASRRNTRKKDDEMSDNDEDLSELDSDIATHRSSRTLKETKEKNVPQPPKGSTRTGKLQVNVDPSESAEPRSDAKTSRLNARRRSESRRASAQEKLEPDDEDEDRKSGQRPNHRRRLSSRRVSRGAAVAKRPVQPPSEEDVDVDRNFGKDSKRRLSKAELKTTAATEVETSETPYPDSSHTADQNTDSRFQHVTNQEDLLSTDSEMPRNSKSTAVSALETVETSAEGTSRKLSGKSFGRSSIRTSQVGLIPNIHHPDAPRRSINGTRNTTAEDTASQDSAPYRRIIGISKHNKGPTIDSVTQESGVEHRAGREETRDTYSDNDPLPRRPKDGKVQLLDRSVLMAFKGARNKSHDKQAIANSKGSTGKSLGHPPTSSSAGAKHTKKDKTAVHRVLAVEGAPIAVKPEDSLSLDDIEACKTRAQNKKAQRLARQNKANPVAVPAETEQSSDLMGGDEDVMPLSQKEQPEIDSGDQGVIPLERQLSRPTKRARSNSRSSAAPVPRREAEDTLPIARNSEEQFAAPISVPVCYTICAPCPPPTCCRPMPCCYMQLSSYGCARPRMC